MGFSLEVSTTILIKALESKVLTLCSIKSINLIKLALKWEIFATALPQLPVRNNCYIYAHIETSNFIIVLFLVAEPEYTPVETTEIVQPKPRPVERSTNNYQSILETASG